MLQIKNGRLEGCFYIEFGEMMAYVKEHPDLKPFIRFHQVNAHRWITVEDMPIHSTVEAFIKQGPYTMANFDAFYRFAQNKDYGIESTGGKHQNYFLVRYDDGKGNMDTEGTNPNGIVAYLKKKGFECKAGYWGCPWYFVDIRNKIFLPGRPGFCYGESIGNRSISFEEFKEIHALYEGYDEDDPILSSNKREPIRVIIDTTSYEERLDLIKFIQQHFPSTKSGSFESEEHKRGFQLVAFHEGEGFGFVGTVVARDLRKKGFDHVRSAADFFAKYQLR